METGWNAPDFMRRAAAGTIQKATSVTVLFPIRYARRMLSVSSSYPHQSIEYTYGSPDSCSALLSPVD